MNPFKVRSKFSQRVAVITDTGDVQRTQQHFKDQCDVNKIMARYNKTGIISHVNRAQAKYGDFTMLGDFVENADKVVRAQQAFDQLPSELRKEFDNDYTKFFASIGKPEYRDKMAKWGILKLQEKPAAEPAQPEPPVTEPVTEPATPPAKTSKSKK